MTDLKTKLLPCPFCGEHLQEATKVANPYPGLARMHPGALDDGTCPIAGWGFYDEQLETWNTRTNQLIALPDEPDAAMVEKVARNLAEAKARWTAGNQVTQEAIEHFLASPAIKHQATAAIRAVLDHIKETGRG